MMGTGSFGCCGWGGAYGWIGLVFNLLVIAAIIWLVVWAVRRFSANSGGANALFNQPGAGQSPREILQARYVRGEITREQYQEILVDLN